MAASNQPRIEAAYYTRDDTGYVCHLCPHHCHIGVGAYGRCGGRRGDEDMLVAYNYGKISSLCVDPMEKKPLYHFRPKERIFSVGGIGCNMTCKHCQNYAISLSPIGKKRATYESPAELVELCRGEGMDVIAFTYNEPMIWFEYIRDVKKYDPELSIVLVTNGLVDEEPLKYMCQISDAMNIDIKGFTDSFYHQVCGASLQDVLDTSKKVFDSGVHLELTYLLIPGYNDSDEEITRFSEWVRRELSVDVPVHFTRFHPDNEMGDVPWTPQETLINAKSTAESAGLNYVYLGNILYEGGSDTICPECGSIVIERTGYLVDLIGLDGDRCSSCKHRMNIIR